LVCSNPWVPGLEGVAEKLGKLMQSSAAAGQSTRREVWICACFIPKQL
jgi:hypothetical protein